MLSVFPLLHIDEIHKNEIHSFGNILLTATHWIAVVFSMLCKLVDSSAYATIILFSVECFPTIVRSTALGICGVMSMLGNIVAPYIIVLVSVFYIRVKTFIIIWAAPNEKVPSNMCKMYIFRFNPRMRKVLFGN